MTEQLTMTFMTPKGVEVTLTAQTPKALEQAFSLIQEPTAPAPAPKGQKGKTAAPKGRKGKTTKAAPKGQKERFVRSASLADFGQAIGFSLEGWDLEELLRTLRSGVSFGDDDFRYNRKTGRFVNIPEGWTFGPRSRHFVATGEWE